MSNYMDFETAYTPQLLSGLGGIAGGLFGNSDAPYDAAMKQYREYIGNAENMQKPYYDAGVGAIPQYQDWLSHMKNPSGFVNSLMGGYQESPYAKYMQQQSMRAGQNAASASGLMGSTPLMMGLQQNAADISSQDMQSWLKNVLGINTEYGQGQQNLMQGGRESANALTNLYGDYGRTMGDAAYGRQAGRNQDFSNMLGGGLQLAGMFL